MSADPRKARTLGEAAQNPDGSYNGFRAMSWLSEVLHPGQGIAEDDIREEYDRKKREGDGDG